MSQGGESILQAIYILSGQGTMRIGKNSYEAAAGDYFALLPGLEDTAHQLRNTSQDTLRYLVMGIAPETRVDICGYGPTCSYGLQYC